MHVRRGVDQKTEIFLESDVVYLNIMVIYLSGDNPSERL